jgi:hypothetical protein
MQKALKPAAVFRQCSVGQFDANGSSKNFLRERLAAALFLKISLVVLYD